MQLCQNHYKENIRNNLAIRTDKTYVEFMRSIETLFRKKLSKDDLKRRAFGITKAYGDDPRCLGIMVEIYKRRELLFGYTSIQKIPTTTNLIECFNSHLQGRLKTIKGFETFKHADLWLNGFFLRRRTKKFTDCKGKFKKLNGKTSLQKSLNPNLDIPSFF